jgi:hypothetical protein
LNAGLYFFCCFEEIDIFLGGAGFILFPKEKFLETDPIINGAMRIIGHGGGLRLGITEKLILFRNSFHEPGKCKRNQRGRFRCLQAKPDVKLFAGGYYRVKDAVIAMVGIDYCYSTRRRTANTSSLKEASNGNGGFEISLAYTGCLGGFILDKPIFFCPRY